MKNLTIKEASEICWKSNGDCKHCELSQKVVSKDGFMGKYDLTSYVCPLRLPPMAWAVYIDGGTEIYKENEDDKQ